MKNATPTLIGELDGVTVAKKKGGFEVSFKFDRKLSEMMRDVVGAERNQETKAFDVPATSVDTLNKIIPSMRQEFKAIAADLEAIKKLAVTTGLMAQRDNNGATIAPRVSDYREPGKFYAGEIVNANSRYVAQLTGFGKDDGVAFIAIHRLADLNNSRLMKGDHVGIKYNEKFQGIVSDLAKIMSAADLAAEFEKNAGQTIDGVAAGLNEAGDKIIVGFDMNPALLARIQRVDGAEFNRASSVWEVPLANKDFALRAVHDMRHEFALDSKEVQTMREIASQKIDSAKVSKAFTKDGQEHFGVVLAVGERYALQKAGQDRFTLHHLAALSQKPEREQNLHIKYNKGRGAVVDLDKLRAQEKALGGVGR